MRPILLALLSACVGGVAAAQVITEFPLPDPSTYPNGIAAGPDGHVWFTQVTLAPYQCNSHPNFPPQTCYYPTASAVSRIAPNGALTEFSILSADLNGSGTQAVAITAGGDGNLWFTEYPGAQIGRMTTAGAVTHFSVSTGGGFPADGITAGPYGNVWFASQEGWIGKITGNGAITQFLEPTAACGESNNETTCGPGDVTLGPDGNVWFTEYVASQIGRLTPAGVITEFPLPTAGNPQGIASGPDGNVWFVEASGNKIGRIAPTGVMTEFGIPTANAYPTGIAPGPDGNLWFTESGANQIGRITPGGNITEFSVPTPHSAPSRVTAGPDGNIWFTEYAARKIARLTLPVAVTCNADAHTLCLNDNRFSVTATFRQTPEGPSAPASAVRITDNTGYFWFFDAANIELVAKVLTGCPVNGEYWVFAGGLTDVGVEMKVTDTVTGATQMYSNAFGTPFQPVQDSAAFPCP